MIILTVKATPLTKHKNDFIKAFHKIIDSVYAEEGCLEYELFESTRNDKNVFIFERWESAEAQEKHMTTEHMVNFFAKIQPWFVSEPKITTYEVK